ncbi:DNA fragmentation factor subunit beta isoform X2 [Patella vulgata]|uniref:DNA fragmentation factor subunit beta isoform X2 n=1 Tax=Patella vulgata TaxID=6465 RepID=UPI0021800EA9|nr:DNA fragmentation factor subunit beta isoform X2 [Patella vulgata]
MLSRLIALFTGGMKAYKVQDLKRTARYGITAKNFKEFLKKGAEKLKIPEDEVTIVLEDDGTLVDSDAFLKTLPTQTVFVFLRNGEQWKGGINKKYKTKSDLMKNSAQTRIRSYYTTAKDQIEKEAKGHTKEVLLDLLQELTEKLKANDFHGHYFDRTAKAGKRLCDREGWFRCQGAFDVNKCELLHTINPYASRGYRQLFGLWNLDHIIEKSREVIPTLIEAAKQKPKDKHIDWKYVYKLLFTASNLKLVQIACHKKSAREGTLKWQDFCQ